MPLVDAGPIVMQTYRDNPSWFGSSYREADYRMSRLSAPEMEALLVAEGQPNRHRILLLDMVRTEPEQGAIQFNGDLLDEMPATVVYGIAATEIAHVIRLDREGAPHGAKDAVDRLVGRVLRALGRNLDTYLRFLEVWNRHGDLSGDQADHPDTPSRQRWVREGYEAEGVGKPALQLEEDDAPSRVPGRTFCLDLLSRRFR